MCAGEEEDKGEMVGLTASELRKTLQKHDQQYLKKKPAGEIKESLSLIEQHPSKTSTPREAEIRF